MIRYISFFAAAVLTLSTLACGGRQGVGPSALTEGGVVTLTGTVLDATSRGLPGVRVEVMSGPEAGTFTASDDQGWFAISGRFAGPVSLRASKDNYYTVTESAIVSNTSGATVRFVLQPLFSMTVHFAGVITDGSGNAVPGATVRIGWPVTGSTTSGGAGRYDFTLDIAGPPTPGRWWGPAPILAEKTGHEPHEHYVQLTPETAADFRLYSTIRLSPGATTRLTIANDDPYCYEVSRTFSSDPPAWSCRTVRMTPSQNGVLTLDVEWENDAAVLGLQVRDGRSGWLCCDSPQSARVVAGTELLIDVVLINGRVSRPPPPGSTSFLVKTSMTRD